MNELTDRLSERLDRLADTAHAHRDVDAVMAGERTDHTNVATSRPKQRVLAQVAAAAVLIAGVGALITVAAVQDPPTAQAPIATEPAESPLPVMPGSEAGTRLVVECLNAAGLDVEIDRSAITYDNRVVDQASYEAVFEVCKNALIADGKLVPLPDEPIPETTTVAPNTGPPAPVIPAETGVLRASVETEVGLFEIFDQIPTGETCQQLTLGDAITSTCYDEAAMDDQMAWSVIGTEDGGDLLYGLVSPSVRFSVVVAGQTIVPDENGIWYATIPDNVRTATLNRAAGPTQIDWQ